MSTEVDKRVVEMQFDNKNFENNVSKTMSTLDKLKQKLHLSGASKGLEEVNRSAKKFDISSMSSGLESVKTKFSALQVMGVTALANITNSAVNAGKRLISAFTIDPVKTGFQEYETQINAVQTILANTQKEGTKIGDVNKALDELNLYADKTIYNFTEMTRNIGTFTAAGVKLKTSVSSIQGIANLAAVSGSTSQQASTAMYQLSQAISSGTVKLQDWNSVVNAGMGGQVFQDALKKTARAHGVAVDDIIKKEGSFRESLKSGWITSEILTETLGKMTKSGATEYLSKLTGVTQKEIKAAQKAVETNKDGSASYEELAEKMAKTGKVTKKEALETLKMADTAEEAATKVKTFSQLMDTLKEAAQSGWAQTWRILVGDFEQARDLFSPLSEFFSGIIDGISKARNTMLESALGKSFTKLGEEITAITKPIKKTADGVKEASKSLEKYGEVVNQIIKGDWGNGQERFDKLTKAGYDWAHAQNLVNEKLGDSTRYETKYADAKNKSAKVQDNATKSQAKNLEELTKMSDAELKAIGIEGEQIKSLRELKKQADKVGMSVSDFYKNIDQIDGRWLIFDSLKTIGKSLVKVLHSVKDAWDEVFYGTTDNDKIAGQRAKSLYNLIAAFHKLSMKLKVSDETADKIKRTFKGLFAIIKLVTNITGGIFKTVFTIAQTILEGFGLDIWDVTAAIGDALVKFSDWISKNSLLTKAIKFLTPYIVLAVNAVKSWINSIIESGAAQKAFTGFVEFMKSAFDKIKSLIIDIKNSEIAQNIISGLVNGLKTGAGSVWDAIVWLGTTLLEKIKDVLGIHSPSTEFFAIGGNATSGLVNGLKAGASAVFDFVKSIGSKIIEIVKNIDFGTVLAGVLAGGLIYTGKKLSDTVEVISAPLEGLGSIFDGVGKILSKSAKGIAKILKGIGKVFSAFAFKMKVDAIKGLVISLAILIGAVVLLARQDTGKLWNAVGVVGALVTILAGLIIVVELVSKAAAKLNINPTEFLKLSGMLISISGALLLLALVVRILGGMDLSALIIGYSALMGFVGVIALLTLITQLAGIGTMTALGKTLKQMSVAMLIMTLVVRILGGMDPVTLVIGYSALMGFVGIITLLILVVRTVGNQAPKISACLLSISVSIAILAAVAIVLGLINIGALAKGIIAIDILSVIMSKLIIVASFANDCKGTIIALTVAVGVMAAAVVALSFIDPSKLIPATLAMSLLMGMFALMTSQAKSVQGGIGQLVVMIGAVAILAGIVYLLSGLQIEGVLGSALALSSLLLAVSAALFIVSKIPVANALMGVLGLLAIAVPLLAFVGILYLMEGLQNAMTNVNALILLTGALTLMLIPLTLVGSLVAGALLGVLSLLAMCVPLLALVGILCTMEGLQNAMLSVMLITTLLNAITKSLVIISLIAPLALLGVVAITAMIGLVGLLGTFMLAIGALAEYCPMMETFLNKALPILELIGQGLGRFLGGIVTGVLSALDLSGLVKIGQDLSMFMVSLTPFIAGANMIDAKAMEGVKSLATMIVILTAAKVLDGLTSWLTGGSSLADFGKELVPFGKSLTAFAKSTAGIDGDHIKKVAQATKILAEMASEIPNSGGLVANITGDNSLVDFGKELVKFGPSLAMYSMAVAPVDTKLVKNSAKAAMELVKLAAEVPNTGGLVACITGDNSLGDFGLELVKFGPCLALYSMAVAPVDTKLVKNSAKAAMELVKMAGEVPNSGGLVACITGDNSLAKFGKELASFGPNLAKYSNSIKDINPSLVKNSAKAAMELVKMAGEVPNTGGLVAAITGDNSLADFGKELVPFGKSLSSYSDKISGIDAKLIQDSAKATLELAKMADSLDDYDYEDIEDFPRDDLKSIGSSIKAYSDKVKGVSKNYVEDSASAAQTIASMIEKLSGKSYSSLKTFPTSLIDLGLKLRLYSIVIAGVNSSKIISTSIAVMSLTKMLKSTNGINVASVKRFKIALRTLSETDLKTFINAFEDAAPKAAKSVKSLIDTLNSGLSSGSSRLKTTTFKMISDILKTISNEETRFHKVGKSISDSFIKGLNKNNKTISSAFSSSLTSAISNIAKYRTKFYNTGSNLVTGFCDGISENSYKVADEAKAMAKSAKKAAKKELDINSPSKVFRKIGSFIPEGFAQGIGKFDNLVKKSAVTMSNRAIDGTKKAISNIADIMNSDIDSQPTIRPVVDLSNVSAGANAINGMFDVNPSVGVMSNIHSINSMMNKNQNGNSELLSAVNGLRDDFASNSNSINVTVNLDYNAGADANDIANDIATSLRRAIRRGV